MQDKRIGHIHPDGSLTYPDVDVSGQSYLRPATIYGIAPRYFVVVPPTGDYSAVVEELRRKVAGKETPEGEAAAQPTPDKRK